MRAALLEYVAQGGRLLIEGGEVAYAHRHDRDVALILVGYNVVHPLYFLDGIWFGLRIASGDNHHSIRVFTDSLPYCLPGLHGGFVRNCAGVDDAEIRLAINRWQGRVYVVEPGIHQLFGNLLGFKLVDLAAQGGDGELHFVA